MYWKETITTAYLAPDLTFALVESNWDQQVPWGKKEIRLLSWWQRMPGPCAVGSKLSCYLKKKKKENSLLGLMNPREPFQNAALSYSIPYSDLESETSSKQVLSLTLFCILQMSHLAKFLRATCIQLVWLPSCRRLGDVPFSVLMPQMPSRKPCAHELLVTLTFGPSDTFAIINLWIMAMETENTKN